VNDIYRMQGHKLHWHLDRVVEWQQGKRIAPLHIDVGLSRGCNIKCHYCYGALQGNAFKKGMENFLPKDILINYVEDAAKMGVRSMALIGEAEPLANPHVYDAIIAGKKAGIDMSLGTNGILYDTSEKGVEALECLEWIRFNISAASHESYRKIHGSNEFATAVKKIKFCVDVKRKKNLKTTIGLQMVLTPKDLSEALPLAKLGKELGVDYLVIKQCSDDTENFLGIYDQLDTYKSEKFQAELKVAEAQSTKDYKVIVKWNQITNEGKRGYSQCHGAPFLLYSTGDGRIYSCGDFFDKKSEEMLLGNLYEDRFADIIQSDRYWKIMEKVLKTIDCQKDCYSNCRTNSINEYLNMVKNPPAHKNFV